MMADFVKNFRAKYDRYPSDWAVMEYDAVYVLKQGVEKAGSSYCEDLYTTTVSRSLIIGTATNS